MNSIMSDFTCFKSSFSIRNVVLVMLAYVSFHNDLCKGSGSQHYKYTVEENAFVTV